MSKRLLALAAAAVVFSLAGGRGRALADSPVDNNQVVVRVGNVSLTVLDLERRIARMPRFQLSNFGTSPDEIRHQVITRVVIPELLLAQGAIARGLDKDPDVRLRERDVLKGALLRQLRRGMESTGISDADVRLYYAQHRAQYDTPPRIAVWRILVATKEQAQQILNEAKKDSTPKTWTDLARTRSLDKATSMRGGNLGFVSDSGETADGKIHVDASVMDAVHKVKDGDIVDHPVAEGSGFAVVWRRGSMPEVHRTLQEEQESIRSILARDRAVDAQERMIADLRAKRLTDFNPSLVDLIDVNAAAEVIPQGKPGRIDRRTQQAGAPESTPRGLR